MNHVTSQLTCLPLELHLIVFCLFANDTVQFVAEVVKELCASSQPTQIKLRLIVCMCACGWLACCIFLHNPMITKLMLLQSTHFLVAVTNVLHVELVFDENQK